MERIIYTKDDGTVSIVTPVDKSIIERDASSWYDDKIKSTFGEDVKITLKQLETEDKKIVEVKVVELTEEQYESFVKLRSIPTNAIKVRNLSISDLPSSREFRNAWVDVTNEARVDISCKKARDVMLKKLREQRDDYLMKSDLLMLLAVEKGEDQTSLKLMRQSLRDATEPLKLLNITDEINDDVILSKIKELGSIACPDVLKKYYVEQ